MERGERRKIVLCEQDHQVGYSHNHLHKLGRFELGLVEQNLFHRFKNFNNITSHSDLFPLNPSYSPAKNNEFHHQIKQDNRKQFFVQTQITMSVN